jgi:hypothetical protein
MLLLPVAASLAARRRHWAPSRKGERPGQRGAPPGTEPRTRGLTGSGSVGAQRCWQRFAVAFRPPILRPCGTESLELEDRGLSTRVGGGISRGMASGQQGSLGAAKAQTPKVVWTFTSAEGSASS